METTSQIITSLNVNRLQRWGGSFSCTFPRRECSPEHSSAHSWSFDSLCAVSFVCALRAACPPPASCHEWKGWRYKFTCTSWILMTIPIPQWLTRHRIKGVDANLNSPGRGMSIFIFSTPKVNIMEVYSVQQSVSNHEFVRQVAASYFIFLSYFQTSSERWRLGSGSGGIWWLFAYSRAIDNQDAHSDVTFLHLAVPLDDVTFLCVMWCDLCPAVLPGQNAFESQQHCPEIVNCWNSFILSFLKLLVP